MALASGTLFAGYTVARRLGSGVTGEVYLVQDPQSARWDALKVLSVALSADGEFCRRFHRETDVAANLYHPHILEVHDRGEFEGQLWIAMDYINASNAAQLMADRFPAVSPAGEVLAIVTAVAAALDHAHQRGLLHRDVKPANIMLTSPGDGEQRILLTDFGIARQLGDAPGTTGTHVPVGTVGYAAPEVLMGAGADEAADQYALAATAFHLLTGAPPVEHSDPRTALGQLLTGASPTLSDQRPELARLDGVFCRALAKKPGDRFTSCREFADAVNEQAGVSTGDRSPEAVLTVDYPAYAWPETDSEIDNAAESAPTEARDAEQSERRGMALRSAAGALARRLDDFSASSNVTSKAATNSPAASDPKPPAAVPKRRTTRLIVLTTTAVVLLVGLLAVGIMIGRKTKPTRPQAASPAPNPSAAAAAPPTSTSAAPPVPLDGTYRIEVQRAKQTFDYAPDPQPPNVNTWWAFRSSCTPTSCTAAGTQLDDNDHTQPNSPGGGRPIVMEFTDGQWQSRPETVRFACVGPNGIAQTQTTTQVLSLRPQRQGDLVGEMDVTVESNECGQRSSVVRIPAVASRSGDVPPAVTVPDPATVPQTPTATPTTIELTTEPTSGSGPGR
ncbi:serine/threonine-protein kinase [Mycobacterium haemophilum]|uniref:non-specific serine/threonine protein kinase n=1 Tax=Mycobacterium haemophilum TaxID=29311 RepID=A0A0I9XQR8_9MYCO|nr:serine/threonine-protein kinase [Mycobacterium haemophilum]KLO29227.1 serine/threonine protein kinase [Mycobacterium haemophilum]KLO35831.1 serine/threonine protein kinase [Mycobacterium haemophilum]KLO41352.1 serine/threonine protein kinase [Mycobacterium haemophilum]KLO49233.1 serine/threonine protein kinase [Mycobacterium haemophilum]